LDFLDIRCKKVNVSSTLISEYRCFLGDHSRCSVVTVINPNLSVCCAFVG